MELLVREKLEGERGERSMRLPGEECPRAGSGGSPEPGALSWSCECKEASVAGAGPARSCTGHTAGISVAGYKDLGFAQKSGLGRVWLEECVMDVGSRGGSGHGGENRLSGRCGSRRSAPRVAGRWWEMDAAGPHVC